MHISLEQFKKIFFIVLVAVGACFFWADSTYALSINAHVPEKYAEIEAGERIYFEIEIKYPENPSRKDLRLEYEIKKEGKVIAQAKFLKAIETQASFVDYIVIPESTETGLYIINTKISDYEELSEEVSTTFSVKGKNNQLQIYFFIIIGLIVIFGIIISWEIRKIIKSKK